jgi:serine/threonine protein kinase
MEGRYTSKRLVASSKETQTKIFQVVTAKGHSRCLKQQSFSSPDERNQAFILQSLQKALVHRNVLRVFRSFVGQDETGFFLVTEIEWGGVDLEEVTTHKAMQKTGWTASQCANILEAMISVLSYAQRLGICHRDIKPMNIFQTEAGDYKLGDFGCAKSAEDLRAIHTITGTPMFLSPKLRIAYSGQIAGMQDGPAMVDHDPYKSDVYSLGLTGLYLLKGRVQEYFAKPGEVTREVGKLDLEEPLRTLLKAMLESEEDIRPNFLQLEEQWKQLSPPAEKSPSPVVLLPKKPSRLKRVSAEMRECMACGTQFSFNQDDTWRKSVQEAAASKVCSERCWTLQFALDAPVDMRCKECGLDDEALYFLHCNLHLVCICHHQNAPSAPAFQKLCPECPQPCVSTQEVKGLAFSSTANSPTQFLRAQHENKIVYYPVSKDIVEALSTANCHFCNGVLSAGNFRYLPHNGVNAFVCSSNCFQSNVSQVETQKFCKVCQTVIPAKVIELLPQLGDSFLWTTEDSCSLCHNRGAYAPFMCNDSVCLPCLSATYRSVQDYFLCPCCGLAIPKADYEDLLSQLKVQ